MFNIMNFGRWYTQRIKMYKRSFNTQYAACKSIFISTVIIRLGNKKAKDMLKMYFDKLRKYCHLS